MSDLEQRNRRIIAACNSGDQQALEDLFQELNIGPDQPREPWDFDRSIPEEERTPTVTYMIDSAVAGRQIEMVKFLYSKFPKTNLEGPLKWAIDTGNLQFVETICELDPASAAGSVGHINIIAYACSKPENAEIVSILFKAGADPNRPPEHTPPYSNAGYAVLGDMPASTFEQFFDCGYRFDDPWAIYFAIERRRMDVVEVLFRRGRDLPTARVHSQQDLIKRASENNDAEMVELLRRLCPGRPKNKGLVSTISRILRFKS